MVIKGGALMNCLGQHGVRGTPGLLDTIRDKLPVVEFLEGA